MVPSFFNDIQTDPDQAVWFLKNWFSEVDHDSLMSIVWIHPTRPKTDFLVIPIKTVLAAIGQDGLDRLIWSNGTEFDLYFAVASNKAVPESRGRRGGLKNVDKVPGVWLDFDVKDGYFSSLEDISYFLGGFPAMPTYVVGTGSGGCHAYWKLDKPVDCDTAKDLALSWWVYAMSLTEGRNIDRLADPSRLLRLPGAIRWPKKPDQPVSPVRLLKTDGPTYTLNQLQDFTSQTWAEYKAGIKKTRERVQKNTLDAVSYLETRASTDKWEHLMKIAGVEEYFNSIYTWDSILEPMGWVKLGEDDEKRVIWSRPGDGIRKSAVTDWEDSPDVMSLFSTSSETGLLHLLESNIVLTKYRVWVELFWDGDEKRAIQALLG